MPYRVHGMMQSYFTRKMTGYLDHKGIPWNNDLSSMDRQFIETVYP